MMKTRISTVRLLPLLALLTWAAAAHAGEPVQRLSESESRVLTLDYPADRILVANPDVATVKALGAREILITGKRAGQTELVLWPHAGGEPRRLSLEVIHDPPLRRLVRSQVGDLAARFAPGDPIEVEWRNERLLLTGSVSGAARRERLVGVLKELGYPVVDALEVVGAQQVQLFVRVAEVIKGNPLRAGTTFFDKLDRYGLAPPGSVSSDDLLFGLERFPPSGTLTAAHSDAFQVQINPTHGNVFAMLSLLEGHRLARVLAQPTLVVESGKTASFLAGGEVPIPVAQDENTISVEYKEFGVILEFTPRVGEGDMIAIHIAPEVSSIDETAGITVGGLSIPGFRVRRTDTSVKVRDGESFIISGLLQDEIRSAVDKVPLLGDIPVLGALFRSSAYEDNRSELAVVVTPRLVRPFRPDEPVPLPGEELAAPSTADALLLGKLVEERDLAIDPYALSNAGLEMP